MAITFILHSESKEALLKRTKESSQFTIVGPSFSTLREPNSKVCPEMKKIPNYYHGIVSKKDNEFEVAKRVAAMGTPISSEELIKDVYRGQYKRLGLVGGAGFGKTTVLKEFSQKLMALNERKEYECDLEERSMVVFLDAKNVTPEESTTLEEILFEQVEADGRKCLLKWVEQNQSKVTILLDGLDQSNWPTDEPYKNVKWDKKASTGTLLYNLMSKNIFPNVTLVVTSRENAMTTLPETARPEAIVALAGLRKEDAITLLSELLGGVSNKIYQSIKNLNLITIPIYVIFTAAVCKFCAEEDDKMPEYASGLLAKILEMSIRSTQMRDTNIEILHKMMSMAFEGMKDRRMIFKKEHLERHGLTREQVKDIMSTVLKKNMHPGDFMEGDLLLIFCHQTLQEFLSACFISKMNYDDFYSFIQSELGSADWKYSHWFTVILYLYGIVFNSEVEFDESLHKGE